MYEKRYSCPFVEKREKRNTLAWKTWRRKNTWYVDDECAHIINDSHMLFLLFLSHISISLLWLNLASPNSTKFRFLFICLYIYFFPWHYNFSISFGQGLIPCHYFRCPSLYYCIWQAHLIQKDVHAYWCFWCSIFDEVRCIVMAYSKFGSHVFTDLSPMSIMLS